MTLAMRQNLLKQRNHMRTIALVLLLAAAGTGMASGSAHAASGSTPSKDQPQKHIVAEGESLSSIAADNNLPSWLPLWDVNTNIQNPDQITPGEVLVIPVPPLPTTDRPLPAGYDVPAPVTTVAQMVVTTAAQPTAHVAAAPSGDLFARIRTRESGGNYAENTGNGYYGAYQFSLGTWESVGGTGNPAAASPAEQDARAQMLYAERGCSPWPQTCS
jgi:LysM repeat protein